MTTVLPEHLTVWLWVSIQEVVTTVTVIVVMITRARQTLDGLGHLPPLSCSVK